VTLFDKQGVKKSNRQEREERQGIIEMLFRSNILELTCSWRPWRIAFSTASPGK
jgi:hypothetical protein